MERLWGVCNTPLHGDTETQRVFTLLTVRSSGAYGRVGVWDG